MNRLAGETSPYLQQHASNPVDWYPWGDEALSRARRESKPILLSIGYSACHWCHVMAHESFEDEHVASLMNDLFVNIKVDREERPDLDQIYQTAHAMLTRRSGGWPLTMFLTPSQEPFFGGTYFPKISRYGLAGFADLLPQIAQAYREQGDTIADQSQRLRAALAMTNPEPPESAAPLPGDAAERAYQALAQTFDRRHGGFGGAPKFPHSAELDFCLRRYAMHRDPSALEIVSVSLLRMAEGGIHDQLGGGFCRYSVDAEWTIPHFEKMLYDNAALLSLYADAWRATEDPRFAATARDIVAWVIGEMRSSEGGFFSSLDADSEHEEGKFYVWTPESVKVVLDDDEYAVASRHWGLDRAPNFEHEAWNLRVVQPLEDVRRELGVSTAQAHALLERAREKLFNARSRRVRPGRDDKMLTSWNALMIAALARASRVLEEPSWLGVAQDAADFVKRELWRDGKLVATFKDGRSHLNAYLDDHAFLLAALVELMQTSFRPADLQWAIEIADALLARFEDRKDGGFFFTSHDHEPLIHRPKPGHDNATPSGNGVAAQALLTLGHWLGETRYLDAAQRCVRAFSRDMAAQASSFSSLLIAMRDCEVPPTTVILTGERAACAEWKRGLERAYRPEVRVLDLSAQPSLPTALSKPHQEDSRAPASAWVCRGVSCLPPIHSLKTLEEALASDE
ncbi:MAG: thioredoxin domain-containing protein [Betaproteobacteria bacterium]|nr:MAG: thioredoxin domain-containing protein [Betaproteobacteria bacterium]